MALSDSVKRVLGIREGELLRVLLMSTYLLLIIGAYIVTKSVRDALFLKRIGIEQLPYVFILIALVVGVISSAYSRLANRLSLRVLIRATSLITISNLFLFWLLLHRTGPWMYYALYIWVSVFGVITASQFWLLANYVFNPREAKRLFSLIGAGGVLGSIFGGYFTKVGAHWFGTENLLLWCMGFMFLTILIMEQVARGTAASQFINASEPDTFHGRSETRRLLGLIWQSRHLTMLTAILGITVMVESFVDYQLKFLSDAAFGTQDQLTSFFGTLFAYLGVFSLVFQIFLTGRILTRLGVGASILFLPIGLFTGSLVLAIAPSLLAVGFLKVSDGSFRYSIHRSGVELLYLPVPLPVKNQVKGFIDMFIDRFGRGLGGLLLILCTQVLHFSISGLSLLVCGFIGIWIYLSVIIRKEYLNTFRLALARRAIEPESLRIRISDSATLEAVLSTLGSADERQVLNCLRLLEDVSPEAWVEHIPPLLGHPSADVRSLALERLAAQPTTDMADAVSQCLRDPDLMVRAEAVHYLCSLDETAPTVAVAEFIGSQSYAIVSGAVLAMTKYHWSPDGIINPEFIRRALTENGAERKNARVAAAYALGLISVDSSLQNSLNELLQDESVDVVRSAIRSCGKIQSWPALPFLLPKLAELRVREDAREALLQYGDKVVSVLYEYLTDPRQQPRVRAGMPRVLLQINSQEAVNCLVNSLRALDPFLSYRVIKALNKMRLQFPHLSFQEETIHHFILDELKNYYEFFTILHSDDINNEEAHPALRLLRQALQERMDQKLERIFRLLGLRYPPKDIYTAYNGIRSAQANTRASAVEFLDNLLLPGLKQLLFPILEESTSDALVLYGDQHFGIQRKTRVAYLKQLIDGRDEWLQTISLYVAGKLGLLELHGSLRAATSNPSETVRQTARQSLKIMEGAQAAI